jgi:EAL and modified HD-GYP domain-containing signal transduction protein
MSASDTFPLVTLQPASDFNNAWVALLLEGQPAFDKASLERIFRETGLADVATMLPIVVAADPAAVDPALVAGLPRESFVLRVPVATAADAAQRDALDALHAAGARIMATGFPAAGAQLAAGVSSLAVTCPGHSMPAGFIEWLGKLPGPHLAFGTSEKICPGFCRFNWLAGHLAGHASPTQKGDAASRSLLLKLLALVAQDAETDEIEALIRRDPNLSYQLLKLVNSVAVSPGKKITSFAQAILLLGRRQLQRWLQLLLYARTAGGATASPLLPRAALRGSLMEGLAARQGLPRETQDHAFMAGMFSLLDVLFGEPLETVIAPLNLADDIAQALLAGSGRLGGLLAAVAAGEGPSGEALADALAAAGIAREQWATALVEALRWTVKISKEA